MASIPTLFVAIASQTFGAADLDLGVPLHGWRFSATTSTRAARLDLDDAAWAPADTRSPPANFQGVGWFRARFSTDEPVERVALLMTNSSVLEIWIDGVRQYVSQSLHLQVWAVPIELGPSDRHVIAVRVHDPDWKRTRDTWFYGGFSMSMASQEAGLRIAARARDRSLGSHALFIGISAALAVLFALLHALYPDERARLYFAGLNAANVGIEACSMIFTRVESAGALLWVWFGLTLSVVAISISLMFVVRSLFFEIPRWYRFYVFAGLGLLCMTWVLPLPALYIYSLAGIGEGLRTLSMAILRKKPGSILIGAGFLCVGIGVAAQAVHDISAVDLFDESFAATIGLLGLLMAMCIKLAMDFAEAGKLEEAHRALEAQHRELVATQAQLIQSEKMASLGRWVAGVAHDMNTPLGAMASARDSISRAKDKIASMGPGDPKLGKMLDVIGDSASVVETATSRISGIVDRLKSFARLDQAEVQRVHIHTCLDDALALVAHDFGDRIEVVNDLGVDLPDLVLEPGEINQVFYNILLNAKQAIAGSGRIVIQTRLEGTKVVVRISDDGSGIAKEVLPRVFDPGFTTKGVGVGAGLGLSIAYRIVESHGGRVGIETELGRGTTVTVELPISGARPG